MTTPTHAPNAVASGLVTEDAHADFIAAMNAIHAAGGETVGTQEIKAAIEQGRKPPKRMKPRKAVELSLMHPHPQSDHALRFGNEIRKVIAQPGRKVGPGRPPAPLTAFDDLVDHLVQVGGDNWRAAGLPKQAAVNGRGHRGHEPSAETKAAVKRFAAYAFQHSKTTPRQRHAPKLRKSRKANPRTGFVEQVRIAWRNACASEQKLPLPIEASKLRPLLKDLGYSWERGGKVTRDTK